MKMKTQVKINVFDKNFKLIHTQEQESRSWVIGLMGLLYIQHAQIPNNNPYNGFKGVNGGAQQLDSSVNNNVADSRKEVLRVVVGGGNTGNFCSNGSTASNSTKIGANHTYLPGHILGIQVGLGNTVATPTDYQLANRLGHGRNVAIAPGTTIVDTTTFAADNTDMTTISGQIRIAGDVGAGANARLHWGACICPPRDIIMTSFFLKLWKVGNPGNIFGQVWGAGRDSGDNHLPIIDSAYTTNNPIATSNAVNGNLLPGTPGALQEFTLATPVHLYAGICYFLGVTAPNGDNAANYIVGRKYAGLAHPYISESGEGVVGATTKTSDMPVLKIVGLCNDEVEYGGCDIDSLVVANPNASFNVRRLFINNSGAAQSIQETGMYALGCRSGYLSGVSPIISNFTLFQPTMICRDVIAPAINLLNTQILQVIYTPAITV